MLGASSYAVLHPFGGAFLMSLMVSVIIILFCVFLVCRFASFSILIISVGSVAVSSMAGSVTLLLATS